MGFDPLIGLGISLAVSAVSTLFQTPQKVKKQETSLRVPKSEYDSPIPKIYGKVRLEGNKFWPDTIEKMYRIETETTSQGGKGGGGGGKGGQQTETEKVYGTWAVLFCEGDVSLERVIVNGQEFTTDHSFFQEYCTFFDGTQTAPWSAMQTIETGDEALIAYKGVCYIGFKDVPLEVYGNQIPTQIGAVLLGEKFGANPDVSLVVRDICESAGVPPDRIDVSDIAGKYVLNEGLLVSQNGESSRKVLEELMQFYLFTAIESGDGVIMFKSFDRGVFTPNTIPTEHYLPINENRIFEETRTAKSQLPNKISLRFYNNNQKYDADEIIEHFEEYTQENDFRVETQISTNPYEARQQARKILKLVTSRQRYSYTFKLPAPYYPYIELLGVLELPNGAVVQIEKITLNPDYTIEVSARRYIGLGGFLYDPPNPPNSSSFPSLVDPLDNGIPDVYFLDIPVINPNNPPNTLYICASAPTTVNISFDGGGSYVASVNHTATSTIGECETALPIATGLDTVNTLNVQLFSGSLSSISQSQFDTGSNLALIARENNGIWEGELIRFKNVLPLGNDRYTISYLQRGDYNTSVFSSYNQVGSKFFLLKGDGAYYSYYANTTNVGQPITYQPVVAYWQDLNTTPVTTINTVGNNYIPLAPTNIESQIDEADNITITWDYPYINNSPFQNGTEIISYEVDIYDNTNTVIRTITTTAQNITYFFGDRQADGVTLPFDIKIYRVSSIVGRGYAGDATITTPTPITGITGNIDADTLGGELPEFYLDRANHTGTQSIATISGLQTALNGLQPLLVSQTNIKSINNNTLLGSGDLVIDSNSIPNFNESVDDRVANLLVAGSNVNLVYNDTANTLTINATGGSGSGGSELSQYYIQGNIPNTNRVLGIENKAIRSIKVFNNYSSSQDIRIISTISTSLTKFAYLLAPQETINFKYKKAFNYSGLNKIELECSTGNVNYFIEYEDSNSDLGIQGTVATTTQTTIYTATQNVKISSIILTNIDIVNASQDISLFINTNSIILLREKITLLTGQSMDISPDYSLNLAIGESLLLQCSVGDVNYFVSATT